MEDLRQTSTGKTHSWNEEEISKNTDLSFLSFYHHFIIIIFIFNSDVRCQMFFSAATTAEDDCTGQGLHTGTHPGTNTALR